MQLYRAMPWGSKLLWVLLFLGISAEANAQQNFFNVPSSNITRPHEVFIQQQFNFSYPNDQSNTTLSWGLKHKTEVGFNVFSVNFDNASHKFDGDSHHQPYAPLLLINVQKLWTLHPAWDFSVGSQSGFSSIRNWVSYDYANFSYHNEKSHTQWVLGTYTSTNGFFGPETRGLNSNSFLKYIGLQTGLEQILWKDKLSVQADFLSGRHSVGELVLGGAYYYRPDIIFSAGYQMPTCKSTSVKALVVEFTYNPGAENKKKHTRRIRV